MTRARIVAPRKRCWPRIFWSILIGVFLLADRSRAADKLEVDLIPSSLRVRAEAPIPVQVKFRWSGTFILEGHLEVELREGERVLARFRSGDMALTTGEQTFHVVLPPCLEPFSDSQVEAHAKFVTAKQTFDLSYSILSVPTMYERSLVLGWCNPHFGADSQSAAQPQPFLFERLAPPSADAARKMLITSVVRLGPEELPTQPLAYTSFDVMVLTSDAFKEAREGQLQALARWVKGGGSVCVFVTGGLRPHHLSFLNGLAGSSAIDPAFAADSDGNLRAGEKKISTFYSGIGRFVVIAGSSTNDLAADPTASRRAIAFLWKFRAPQVRSIAETGYWDTDASAAPSEDPQAQIEQYRQYQQVQRNGRRFYPQPPNFPPRLTYSIQPGNLRAELMQQLMPRTVRLIPFSALMTILCVFLLMIGPVDYFALGWLRRRRYTWVLFPATSIAFMIATVSMANYYLGLRDQRRSLIVVDLDKDGSALRWNRYELIFAARDKQAVTELKDALWAPIESSMGSMDIPSNPYAPNGYGGYNQNFRPGYRNAARTRETGPPWYEGTMPVHFRTSEFINQWQPKLNRIFSFEPPPVPLLANWSEVEKAWPDLKAVRSTLSGKNPFTGDLCAISGNGAITFDLGSANQSNVQPMATPREFDYDPEGNHPLHVTITGATNGAPNWIMGYPTLSELCVGRFTGLQSLVSQVSPNGGGNFEDSQAMDGTAGDSALMIITHSGDDIIVYRRFFHGK
jgi:hypothetical protein